MTGGALPKSDVLPRARDVDAEVAGCVEHALVVAHETSEVGAELEGAGEVDGVEGTEMGGQERAGGAEESR